MISLVFPSVNQVMYVVLYLYFDIGDFDSMQRNGAANSNGIVGHNIASLGYGINMYSGGCYGKQ